MILPSSKVKSSALVNHSSGHDNEYQDFLLPKLRTAGLDARAKVSPIIQYAKSKTLPIGTLGSVDLEHGPSQRLCYHPTTLDGFNEIVRPRL